MNEAERNFHNSRREVYKKFSRKIKWNGHEFESIRAMQRHLRLASISILNRRLKDGKEYQGHKIEYIK